MKWTWSSYRDPYFGIPQHLWEPDFLIIDADARRAGRMVDQLLGHKAVRVESYEAAWRELRVPQRWSGVITDACLTGDYEAGMRFVRRLGGRVAEIPQLPFNVPVRRGTWVCALRLGMPSFEEPLPTWVEWFASEALVGTRFGLHQRSRRLSRLVDRLGVRLDLPHEVRDLLKLGMWRYPPGEMARVMDTSRAEVVMRMDRLLGSSNEHLSRFARRAFAGGRPRDGWEAHWPGSPVPEDDEAAEAGEDDDGDVSSDMEPEALCLDP